MTYVLSITRDGDDIMSREITADNVVDLLTGNFLTPIVQEETEEEVEPVKRHYKKKGKKAEKTGRKKRATIVCSNCGEEGHQKRTCPKNDSSPSLPTRRSALAFEKEEDDYVETDAPTTEEEIAGMVREDGTTKLTDVQAKVDHIKSMQEDGYMTKLSQIQDHYNLNDKDAAYLWKRVTGKFK